MTAILPVTNQNILQALQYMKPFLKVIIGNLMTQNIISQFIFQKKNAIKINIIY